jgi:predicted dehydrogenase
MRAAIVGLGWWGQTLVNSGHGKGIDFVLGTSRTKNAKAQEFCQGKGIKIVDDFDAVLADSSIDGVVLATPHSQHGDQVRKAAAAGKHVFIEKPFTLTAPDAASAIEAMKKAGKVLAVGFNRRFHPNMLELKARVKDGRMGDLVNVIGEQSGTAAYVKSTPQDTWRATSEEAPAGAMTGIGIHTLDSMIGLFGPLDEVHCIAARRAAPHVDDTTAVLLRFKSGLPGLLFCSFATAPAYRMAVYGSKGLAEITKPSLEDFKFTPAPGGGDAEASQKPGFDTVNAELRAFAEAASGGQAYPIPTDEILNGVQAFEAIVRSSKEGGKPMKVAG